MNIAYLVNQYPKVSHTFIRREIQALERIGNHIVRFSIRPTAATELPDPVDHIELNRTSVILADGAIRFGLTLAKTAMSRPRKFFSSLGIALRLGWGSERGLILHMIYLAEACVLLKKLHHLDVEHLHAHFGTNSATVAYLCHALGGPSYSFTVHGPEEFDKPRFIGLAQKIEHAAFVCGVSLFGISQLYRQCSVQHWPKIRVLRCGIDGTFLNQSPSPVPDVPVLVCIGRICEQKGQLILVKAAAQLAKRKIPFKIILVGDGEMRSQVENEIARFDLEDHISIHGWANGDEVRKQLKAARCMVLPSFAEGLPVVIMEAMALARPVISTYIAGIPELVVPGKTGWLVPAGAVDDLASAMAEVLQSPVDQLSAMGQAGRQLVFNHHEISNLAGQLTEHFRAALTN